MYLLQVAGVVLAIVSFCHGTGNDLACSSSSVTTVTVTATNTVTETLGLPGLGPYWFPGGKSSSTPQSILTVTETLTITEVLSSTVTSSEAAASTSSDSGVYYFSVENSTTVWLGATPPATESSYVLQTSTAVIQPLPYSSAISTNSTEYTTSTQTVDLTSFLTLTIVSTETILTETITETISSTIAAATASGFTGIGANGWNGTTVNQENLQTGFPSSGIPWPTSYATAAPSVSAPHFANHYSGSAWLPSGKSWNSITARQVGAVVTATIDGVVVSWTNVWDGGDPHATPIPSEVTVPAYSWTPSSSSAQPSSSTAPEYSYILPTVPTTSATPSDSCSLATASSTSSTFIVPSTLSSTASSTFTTIIVPSSSAPLTSSTVPYPNITSATTTSASVPSSTCDPDISFLDLGNFTITFDDLPAFSESPSGDIYPPIFSPYHDLYWSQGFAYAPPPSDPYAPISPPKLAVFVTNQSANVHPVNMTSPPGPADDVDGQFGAGPNFANSAFWINAYSAYVGCADAGPASCELTINGYGYEPNFGNTVLVARQTAYQPPCPGLVNCELMYIEFGPEFNALTSLQIVATLPGNATLVTWYMDNLAIGWTNTTCAAAEERYEFSEQNPPV